MTQKIDKPRLLLSVYLGIFIPNCHRPVQVQSSRQTVDPISRNRSLPLARVEETTDTYFGQTVLDPYRWMEKPENQKELQRWMRIQGEHTRTVLQQIPERQKLVERLKQLMGSASSIHSLISVGDSFFYLKRDKDSQLSKLIMRNAQRVERVLADPKAFENSKEQHFAIHNFSPSHDGRFVAYNLSKGGSEISQVRIVETETGKLLPDEFEAIWGEFNVHWMPDNSGVFYTQMAQEAFTNPKVDKLQNMQVFYHQLGTPTTQDVLVLGTHANSNVPFTPEEFPIVQPIFHSNWVLGFGLGARPDRRIMVAKTTEMNGAKTPWKVLAEYQDKVSRVSVQGDTLYFLTTQNAPYGEVRRVSLLNPKLTESDVVVPQSTKVIQEIVAAKDALYFTYMNAGVYELFRLPNGSTTPIEISMPFAGTITLVDTSSRRSEVLFSLEGWTQPKRYLSFKPSFGPLEELGLSDESPANYDAIVVKRIEVKSSDGTLVPMTLLQQNDLPLNGKNPAILTGYGGYGKSRTPKFVPNVLAWLEMGGIYAYAHVRGGGEKGRDWHRAGQGKNKKNGVQDFIACAEYLIQNKYTSSQTLAARGGSMGGVLIGRAITERPELFGASAIFVGLLNPLRYLYGINGANQKAEYDATPETKSGFETLFAMDPYHNIKAGTSYPPIMLVVGMNDQRVAPWMSAKFAARLQATGASTSSVLIRTDEDSGHGLGSTKDQEWMQLADEWTFYLQQFRAALK